MKLPELLQQADAESKKLHDIREIIGIKDSKDPLLADLFAKTSSARTAMLAAADASGGGNWLASELGAEIFA